MHSGSQLANQLKVLLINMAKNIRALAAKCVFQVVDNGRSLSDELPQAQSRAEGKDKGLLQELCYGVLRFLPELEHSIRPLVKKPLKGKQRVVHFLMLVGVYQLKYTRIPDHAALSETVNGVVALKSPHLKGMVNGILRNFQRSQQNTDTTDAQTLSEPVQYNHPGWFIKKVQEGYPQQWSSILLQNQEKPPMWLRVNQQKSAVDDYIKLLEQAEIGFDYIDPISQAVKLTHPVDVGTLPKFEQGWVSIQDGAAQQAAKLLDTQANDKVLDCCAAPGGKTCHIMESQPNLASMTAIDVEPDRLARVQENLARLGLNAKVIAADAAKPESWWDGDKFDRILLDAPCSGTGVIRRHPDIKWLRKASDINELTTLQAKILRAIWALLKPGGTLVYATCSILPEENVQQIKAFLDEQPDAVHVAITDKSEDIGWQILPGDHSMDGFYYAKLTKKN